MLSLKRYDQLVYPLGLHDGGSLDIRGKGTCIASEYMYTLCSTLSCALQKFS